MPDLYHHIFTRLMDLFVIPEGPEPAGYWVLIEASRPVVHVRPSVLMSRERHSKAIMEQLKSVHAARQKTEGPS